MAGSTINLQRSAISWPARTGSRGAISEAGPCVKVREHGTGERLGGNPASVWRAGRRPSGRRERADAVHSPALRAAAGMSAGVATRSEPARGCVEGGRGRGRRWGRRHGGCAALPGGDQGAERGAEEIKGGLVKNVVFLDQTRLLSIEPTQKSGGVLKLWRTGSSLQITSLNVNTSPVLQYVFANAPSTILVCPDIQMLLQTS